MGVVMFARSAVVVASLAVLGQAVVGAGIGAAGAAPGSEPAVPARAVAPTWSPVKVFPEVLDYDTVIDRWGTVTVVWEGRSVVAIRRPAGGPWSKRVVIGRGVKPRLAVDARGTVTAVWLSQVGYRSRGVQAARFRIGRGWSDPVTVAPNSKTVQVTDLRIAANAAGDLAVAWVRVTDPDTMRGARCVAAFRTRSRGWQQPVSVAPADGYYGPAVGIDAAGRAAVLYGTQQVGHEQVLRERIRRLDGSWTTPVVVGRGGDQQFDVDPAGNATVLFESGAGIVRGTSRTIRGTWTSPARLKSHNAESFALATASHGTTLAAVSRWNRSGSWVDLYRRAPDGSWRTGARVDGLGGRDLGLSANRAGAAFLGSGEYGLYGRYRPAGGGWGPRVMLSPETAVDVMESVVSRMAANGDVVVLWKQEDLPLKARVLDAS